MHRYIILFFLLCISSLAISQYMFLGPMVHWNIDDNNGQKVNWGIELSYWDNEKPLGLDVGLEFAKTKTWLYSEFQIGAGYGMSFGFVNEIGKDDNEKFGFQASAWGVFLVGADIRFRWFADKNYFSPGLMLKAPIYWNMPNKFGNFHINYPM